jgi:maleamate amidohydrolase
VSEAATVDLYSRQGFGGSLGLGEAPALILVDFVNGFLDPDQFGGGNIPEAAARSEGLLAFARANGWPVAHTRIVFADDGADANVFSRKAPTLLGLTEDAVASQIIPSLTPLAGELVVRKTLPSAFAGSNLGAWLAFHKVDCVVVGGCVTSGCVRATVTDAMNLGLAPTVVSDCVGDRALGPHEANLFDMGQKCADVISFDTLTETWRERRT